MRLAGAPLVLRLLDWCAACLHADQPYHITTERAARFLDAMVKQFMVSATDAPTGVREKLHKNCHAAWTFSPFHSLPNMSIYSQAYFTGVDRFSLRRSAWSQMSIRPKFPHSKGPLVQISWTCHTALCAHSRRSGAQIKGHPRMACRTRKRSSQAITEVCIT